MKIEIESVSNAELSEFKSKRNARRTVKKLPVQEKGKSFSELLELARCRETINYYRNADNFK